MAVQNLDGLQYATNLVNIEVSPNTDAQSEWDGAFPNAKLSDISALAGLTKLATVNISLTSVHDISALKGKRLVSKDPNNGMVTDLSHNEITDISPLQDTQGTLPAWLTIGYQAYILPTITLNKKVTSLVTPSFIIKNIDDQNVPITPYYNDASQNDWFSEYTSTANGGAIDNPQQQLTWTDLKASTIIPGGQTGGYLTAYWSDKLFGESGYPYDGVVIQPFIFSDTVGNINVNFKNDAGQYIYGQQTLSGTIGDSFNYKLASDNKTLADPSSTKTTRTLMGFLKISKIATGIIT